MMTVKELCGKIGLPDELTEKAVLSGYCEYASFSKRFCDANDYEKAYAEWNESYGVNDKDGIVTLALMLNGARMTYESYSEKKIQQKIFFDTMKCFSRFCEEFRETYGRYGFDRGFWTGRQLSMRLFRIDALEYELCGTDGKKEISVHIPSDADLKEKSVERSLEESEKFFEKYYPEYKGAEYHCTSWLLSPSLLPLLPSKSNIRTFASLFEVKDFYPDDESYKVWLFKDGKIGIQDAPQNTSLQRSVKNFVLSGGRIGEGHGVLKKRNGGERR